MQARIDLKTKQRKEQITNLKQDLEQLGQESLWKNILSKSFNVNRTRKYDFRTFYNNFILNRKPLMLFNQDH